MNTYYVSLVRGLVGYFVKFKATDEYVVREHCAEYFGRLWCSVYDESIKNTCRGKFICINEDNPIELGDNWEWE